MVVSAEDYRCEMKTGSILVSLEFSIYHCRTVHLETLILTALTDYAVSKERSCQNVDSNKCKAWAKLQLFSHLYNLNMRLS